MLIVPDMRLESTYVNILGKYLVDKAISIYLGKIALLYSKPEAIIKNTNFSMFFGE